ncbi:MAG TPA: hypothetical protein VGL81_19460 [Polyangiaceae bacterium]|jgi:hypothetical protein
MGEKNNTELLAELQDLSNGLVKHASDIPSLVLGTQTIQNADLVGRIQQVITSKKATASAHVNYLAAVASEKGVILGQAQFLDDLKQTLRARFSTSSTTLADFGLAARTRAKPTPKTQVAAAAKVKATREARGTKGSKQLAEVQGNVTGVVVTPVVAGAPATEPTNAPATPPAASGAAAAAAPPAATPAPKS